MGPVTVRGLAATRALPSSSTLLRVPLRCTIRDTHVPKAYPGAPWNVSMAVFLLGECRKHRMHMQERREALPGATPAPNNKDSWFWPYIVSMPGMGSSSPLLFDDLQLAEVCPLSVARR
jgi:hypothetical protein